MIAVGLIESVLVLAIFALVAVWLWTLVDCAAHEPKGYQKSLWILGIAIGNWCGALLYLIIRRPRRLAERGRN